jgi:hypothetical protein
MWFLHRKVIITKDNLLKRSWAGCPNCAFCNCPETVEHLFIRCPFAKLVWQVVFFTFNVPPPANIKNLFGQWLNGIDKNKTTDSCRSMQVDLGNVELSQ